MVKAVIFDVDNTLYSYTKAHAAAFTALKGYAKEKLGISSQDFECLHRNTEMELKEYMGNVSAMHNRLIRYQNMLEKKSLPLYPHVLEMDRIYWDTLLEASAPSDGASETMQALKKQGFRIGIGTDMTARMQFRKLTRLGLLPYVDFLVSSEEAGAEKPDPKFFALCVKKAGCKKEECLFVGDSLAKDVQGALRAGLKAVWYCPDGKEPGADILKITNMAQLPRMAAE